MRSSLVASAAFAVMLGASVGAHAGPLSAETILSDFNGVIFKTFSNTSDVEGPIVIGSDLTGGASFNTNPRTTPPAGLGAVTVYGSASGGPYNVDNSGDVYVEGGNTATFNLNGGSKLTSVPNTSSDFDAVGSSSNGLSATLSALSANSTMPSGMSNVPITANPDASGIAVFDATAAELDSYQSFDVDTNGAKTVIFNVSDSGSVSLTSNFQDESEIESNNNIIWNFPKATSISFGTEWGGVVLAPSATVTNSTPIEGVLVADSFDGTGELHNYGFDGTLPSGSSPTPVPEPGSLALLATALLGLGASGWLFRRKRSAAL